MVQTDWTERDAPGYLGSSHSMERKLPRGVGLKLRLQSAKPGKMLPLGVLGRRFGRSSWLDRLAGIEELDRKSLAPETGLSSAQARLTGNFGGNFLPITARCGV